MNKQTLFLSFLISGFFYWLSINQKPVPGTAAAGADRSLLDAIKNLDSRIKSLENSPFA